MYIRKFFMALVVVFPLQLFADSTEQTGEVLLVALPITVAGISIKKHDTDGLKQYLLDVGVASAATFGLKYIVNEKRPDGGSHSFPSEHAAIAFASAGFLWRRYGYKYGIPATVVSGFVGYSRIEANKHYWHDVVAGAAIGLLSSYVLVKPLQITYPKQGVEIGYYYKLSD